MSSPGPAMNPSSDMARFTTTFPAAVALIVFPRRSAGPREAEVDRRRRRVGPPLRDDLSSCVEGDALGFVNVVVAEQGCLPPAERVVRDRNGDRYVDPDHPGLDVELEPPSCTAVA